ncbi:hypothetical protein Y032_0040g223 [Ancylostoma ceylanicum]|uniref:Uncharacterized protein n=1 Tax=Ancylostoma ceylanicum TaxID=53326 RepID=A0A016UI12_9BILA|nr:hypothetical protein Y032_0040g223 [Ancylostoma ceylanicum]
MGPTVLDRQSTITSSMPFPARGIKLPKPSSEVDSRIASLEMAIERIYLNETTQAYRIDLTPSEQRGITKLLRSKDRLRYTIGDKCGSFVVMPQSMDENITNRALSGSSTYCETTMATFSKACDKVKQAITTVVKPMLGAIVAKQLLYSHPIVPTFYSLVKTLKHSPASDLIAIPPETIKIRPILSTCGGSSDRLSWLLVKVLSPVLQFVGAHIVNVESILASLSQCQIPSAVYYASFEVTSLYTNANNDYAVDAVISLYEQHESQIHSMGFNANDIKVMLSATLSCSIFCLMMTR